MEEKVPPELVKAGKMIGAGALWLWRIAMLIIFAAILLELHQLNIREEVSLFGERFADAMNRMDSQLADMRNEMKRARKE